MALVDNAWYVDFGDGSTTGYYAITKRAASTAVVAGAIRRQFTAPAVGSERVFICIVAGTTSASTDATWVLTRGAKTTDGTVTWQECTGQAALNGDKTNTPTWATVKNTAVTLGQVIQNVAGTLILICSTAGTAGNGAEPTWGGTAGNTTADNTATWTTLGASFSNWSAPAARLLLSFTATWGQAGNKFFVASEHAETQGSAITLIPPGTIAKPVGIYCVGKTNVPPTSADETTGATVSTTGAFDITLCNGASYALWRNMTFKAGSSASAGNIIFGTNVTGEVHTYENCVFTLNNTSASSRFSWNNSGGAGAGIKLRLINPTFNFGNNAFQQFSCSSGRNDTVEWIGGSVTKIAAMTGGIFGGWAQEQIMRGVDLSTFGSGVTLFDATTGNGQRLVLEGCKLGSSVTICNTPTVIGAEIFVANSDSGAVNYRNEKYAYPGTETTETTIVRTGGASDGTQAEARKLVTNANASWRQPFEGIPLAIWNDLTGSSKTVTVYGIAAALPNSNDLAIDVYYMGSSGSPLYTLISSQLVSDLATPAALSSDGSTWGGSTTPFKMSVTLTPQMKGPIYIRPRAFKASTTFYIDPLPVIT